MEYLKLVGFYEELEKHSAKLKKTKIISDLLKETEDKLLPKIILLVQGRVFPPWSEKVLGVASKLMIKAISNSTGFSSNEIIEKFKLTGDLGLVTEELVGKKKQLVLFKQKLTVEKVFENMRKIAEMEGKGSQERKLSLISELITSSSPKEAKYIVRTVLGDLRVGVAEGIIRDAIAKAYFSSIVWDKKKMINIIEKAKGKKFVIEKGLLKELENKVSLEGFKKNNEIIEKNLEEIKKLDFWKVKSNIDYVFVLNDKVGNEIKKEIVSTIEGAWFLRPDYGEIALIAKTQGLEGLKKVEIKIGEPIEVMLAEKANTLEQALEDAKNPAIEFKYDGMRAQIHKKGDKIWIYTRRLENITEQFPDLVKLIRESVKEESFVIEGEVVAVKDGKPMPFQKLSQRIQRKYDIPIMVKEIPIQINLFDIVYLNGETLLEKPLKERREILEKIVKTIPGKVELAKQLITKDLEKANKFYKEALDFKQEGVMVKNLDAKYQAGKRVGYWYKVKPVMETLDLVIIGAQWGEGRRAKWLGSFILACRDPDTGKFLPCGKMGTGLSDQLFEEATKKLKELIIKEEGKNVEIKPKIVVEVAYEEIQKSPNYESGFALRFPRLERFREDKGPEEADTIERVKSLYESQSRK